MRPLAVLLIFGCSHSAAPLAPDVVRGEHAFAEAERFERDGRWKEAALEYEKVARVERSTRGREPSRALVRAAEIWDQRVGDRERAERDCWQAIRAFPDAAPTDDAVRELVRLKPPRLRENLLATAVGLSSTEIGDNLRWEAARLIDRDEPVQARAEYEALARDYPKSGLRDDALWRAAHLAHEAGDLDGALEDLRVIVAKRRDAMLVGSFNSALMDDAQLEIGRIWLEDKKDVPQAVRAWEELRDDMPDSTLRDDAQMWIARAWSQAGDRGKTCEALARLKKQFPDSRYLKREAPELAQKAGCG